MNGTMVLLFVGTAALLVSVLAYRHATTAEARRREVRIRLEEARRAFSPAEAEVTLEDAVRSAGDRSRAEGTERREERSDGARRTGEPEGVEDTLLVEDLESPRAEQFDRAVRLAMQVLITFVGLVCGVMFILDGCHAWLGWCQEPASAEAKNWASGFVGTVVGFWLTKA
ncbi:MAG: hypothetical protein M3341_03200 [Actinomycetota bacterium]|nr:hypothetical protein [Actinomycetota bacterium]